VSTARLQLDRAAVAESVQEVVQQLLDELGNHRGLEEIRNASRAESINALHLDRDLGLGSLERVEFIVRAGGAFRLQLPDELMAKADTLGDVISALEQQLGQGSAATSESRFRASAASRASDSLSASAAELGLGSAETLIEVLRRRGRAEPERLHIRLREDEGGTALITCGGLLERVTAFARGLENLGIAPGERIAILLPTCRDFFSVFLGAQMAGAVPVPIYPPFRPDRIEEYAARQSAILRSAGVSWMITFSRAEKVARLLKPQVPSLRGVSTTEQVEDLSRRPGSATSARRIRGEDIAFLQYTSGSTGDPKGVTLTHANLLANIRAIAEGFDFGPHDQAISWLPLYHDMGLIGAWLTPLYVGAPLTIMSPLAFLSRPERWLWAIHQQRGSVTAAPNFAYELCVRKVSDEQIEGIDLSSMRLMLNGAEPVNPVTVERFCERYARYGFPRGALMPVYGLAENSLGVTYTPPGRGPLVDRIERATFEREGRAVPLAESPAPGSAQSAETESAELSFVSSGVPFPQNEVRIVDETGNDVPERVEGRLWFRSPSATSGYYRNPAATQALLKGNGWLDSGDRAYLAGGEAYITGRAKDIIIKAGRNLYPHEVEELAGSVSGVRKGCVVAFGVSDAQSGTEKLIVVAESSQRSAARREEIAAHIREKLAEGIGLPPDDVEVVAPGTVPKTSSGKLRRDSTKQLYVAGKLGRRRLPVWLQVTRLAAKAAPREVSGALKRAWEAVYGAYWLLMVVLLAATVWTVLNIVPRRSWAVRLSQKIIRGFFILVACPLRVEGIENLAGVGTLWGEPSRGGALLVSNHTSYSDSVVLLALISHYNFRFVAKQEVMSYPFIGGILRKLGFFSFVRESREGRLKQADEVEEALRQGDSVMIFPEGTFTPAPGLRPFQLGAFKAAASAGRPVVPLSLRGTREILRDETILPKRGRVTLTIGTPLHPTGAAWQDILQLRDAARAAIGSHCGEPIL
jgi:fatty-acyl-CoA synthase